MKNEPHPNFGHYKVLLGTETKTGLYSFETFDLVDGKPIGKFIVSYPVGPYYREVAFDGALMVEIRKQLEISKQKQRESFQNLLKKKE